MTERWRAIPGFADYEISNKGRVRSWKPYRNNAPIPTQPTLLITRILFGYVTVGLRFNNKQYNRKISRLVLMAWRPSGAGICRHLNGISTDNRLVNLKWGTYAQNVADSKRHGTFPKGTKVHNAKLTEDQVRYIKQSTATNYRLGKELNIDGNTIRLIRLGKRWKHVKCRTVKYEPKQQYLHGRPPAKYKGSISMP